MADPTDTTGGTTGAAAATGAATGTTGAASSTPGTTAATTGAAAGDTGATGATATTGATTGSAAPQVSAAPPLDTLLSGLETLAMEVIEQELPSLSLQLNLPLADASKATLALYLTPPAQASTSGTAPKGGCLGDVLASVRTAVNDSATFGETMTVEQGYVCVTSLQRT